MAESALSGVQFQTHPRVQRLHRPDRPRFSHFEGNDEELAALVSQKFGKAKMGNLPDTYIIRIEGEVARRFRAPGERKISEVVKPEASSVRLVVWSKTALENDGDVLAKKMKAHFAVVSIKAIA